MLLGKFTFQTEMSLGLISGYGSDSGSENEGEDGNPKESGVGYQVKKNQQATDFEFSSGFSPVW